MNGRIRSKIEEIERYISELSEIKPETLEEYLQDFKTKAACERYAEKIVEALVDLAFFIIKDKNLKSPENDSEAFKILSDNKIIHERLSDKLQDAKGMRNILAHEYGEVNDEIVFEAITNEIEKDAIEFISIIKRLN